MATSRLPAVVDALLTLMRATTGYRDPSAAVSAALVPVFDGPTIGISGDHATRWLSIGWSGDPESPEDAASAEQNVATGGNNTRDEVGTIRCRAAAQGGETDPTPLSALRLQVGAIVGDVELLLRNNPTLGITAPRMFARIGEIGAMRQSVTRGPSITTDFTVIYDTRI